MHEMFDLNSPSATYFCRICWITRPIFKEDPLYCTELRTTENYEDKLQPKKTREKYNIKAESIFNKLADFCITQNYTLDLLHDFGEGVTQLLLNRVFRFCCKEPQANGRKMFSLAELNQRIQNFEYGILDMREKPSEISLGDLDGNKVGQKAYQAFLLFRALPCLLYDKFLQEDTQKTRQIQKLITHHSKILSIVMSTSIHQSDLEDLDCLYVDFVSLLCAVFDDIPRINKLHHIRHYKECIKQCGPCRFYNTAGFEHNHLKFKNKSKITNNFRNITKTLIKFNSFELLNNFLNPKQYPLYKITKQRNAIEINYIFTNIVKNQKFSTCTSINFDNINFNANMYICIHKHEAPLFLPKFGKIKSMCVQNNNLYFYAEIVKTVSFSNIYFGYIIEPTQNTKYIEVNYNDLDIKESFCHWTPINSNKQIIYKKTLDFH